MNVASAPYTTLTAVTDGARWDALWLANFLTHFNSRTIIRPTVAQQAVFVDACLQGAGGHAPGLGLYAYEFPDCIQRCQFSINSLEAFNILVCLRLWASHWTGQSVILFCDNWASVCATNSGRAKDHDVLLTIRHRPGAQMHVADALSRGTLSDRHAQRMQNLVEASEDELFAVPQVLFAPPIPI